MHLVVIGNGIAGVTAARYVRARDPAARITLVSDEAAEPFARTALMYVYMGTLSLGQTRLYAADFWARNRIDRVLDRAERLDTARREVVLRDGAPLAYDRLLVATGSVPAFPPFEGAALRGVQGFYHLADLDRLEAATAALRASGRRAVVVGGGLIGVELAEMLRVRGIPVTFLVREASYYGLTLPPEEGARIGREIERHGVDLRLGTELHAVRDDGTGAVGAVETTAGEVVEAGFVGVATGVRPNIAWLGGSGVETGRGVLVDEALRTSAPGVFAAGDCAELRAPEPGRRATEPLWYTARIQGATAAHGILGRPAPYRPGVYFNSAKFFDLEWQVYGRVDAAPPEGEGALVAADGGRLVRLQHGVGPARPVVGVQALGVRLRQDVCSAWVAAGTPLAEAVAAFGAAEFDGEFAPAVAPLVADAYAAAHGARVRPARRGLAAALAFLR